MKMTMYASASFIGLDAVKGGPFRDTIAVVELGGFGKPVIEFANGRKFSLNKTNTSTLIEALAKTPKTGSAKRSNYTPAPSPTKASPSRAFWYA